MASIKPKEAFVVTDLHGTWYVIDNREEKTYVVCESDFKEWTDRICELLNKSVNTEFKMNINPVIIHESAPLKDEPSSVRLKFDFPPKKDKLTFKQRVKGVLVHFFRSGTQGDYKEALDNAVDEISDEEREYWDDYFTREAESQEDKLNKSKL